MYVRIYKCSNGDQGRQSKCKSGKALRYSYNGYKTALAAAKGNLIYEGLDHVPQETIAFLCFE